MNKVFRIVSYRNKTTAPNKQPTIGQFYEHFKNINETEHEQDDIPLNMHLDDSNEILNSSITCDEIRKCINNLKNGKSPGGDHILNEYIKSTKEIFFASI